MNNKDLFKLADLDNGNRVDKDEFRYFLKGINKTFTDHHITEVFAFCMMDKYNNDRNKEMEFFEEEFVLAMHYIQ